jgi:nitrate/TMAO reductase-like tetraheme cytochrome c subunit
MSRKPVLFGLGIVGIIIVLLVGALGLGAATVYTSTSTFCNSCHEMSTQYASWTRY